MSVTNTIVLSAIVLFLSLFLTLDVFQGTRIKLINSVNELIYQNPVKYVDIKKETPGIEIYNIISSSGDKLYTKTELSKFDGTEGSPGLYLGILGRVYDVSKGKQHYGPGGGYEFFSGKDGTKAFMTGKFNQEGLIDETTGLTNGQMIELENWIKFYDTSYKYKGKLEGNFYNSKGEPTQALYDTVEAIKLAHVDKKKQEDERQKFPPCNSQSKQGEYRRVYCTDKSGGVKRTWVGYPRQYFKSSESHPKCVCVQAKDLNNPLMKEYEDCEPRARSCDLPPL